VSSTTLDYHTQKLATRKLSRFSFLSFPLSFLLYSRSLQGNLTSLTIRLHAAQTEERAENRQVHIIPETPTVTPTTLSHQWQIAKSTSAQKATQKTLTTLSHQQPFLPGPTNGRACLISRDQNLVCRKSDRAAKKCCLCHRKSISWFLAADCHFRLLAGHELDVDLLTTLNALTRRRACPT